MPFSELIAQDRALAPLRSALRRGALHHAYLFGGPPGVGKATAARILAQAANCVGPESPGREGAGPGPAPGEARDEACGRCGPCHKIEKGVHPDVYVLSEEREMVRAGRWEAKGGRSPSKDIVVDQVRDLVDHRLALRRFEGRRRFVIIDPADAMNPQAQNALLKTLEEPPPDTTLVLVASSPDSLLPTIRSRCLRVAFGPLPAALIQERLAALAPRRVEERVKEREKDRRKRGEEGALSEDEREGLAAEVRRELQLAAALSGGSLSRALQVDGAELRVLREALEVVSTLPPDDAGAWLAFAGAFGKGREETAELCELLALWLRDVLAVQAQGDAAALALPDRADATRALAAALGPAEVLRRRERVLETAAAVRQNAAPVLALERLLIGWFHGRA